MDLTQYPSVWTGELDALAPRHLPDVETLDVDDEDRFLLTPLSVALPAGASSAASRAAPVATQRKTGAADVVWLRRTEYLASSGHATPDRPVKERPGKDKEDLMDLDTSREAAVARINETFTAVQESSLMSLRHPTKSHLRATASYDFLPDVDTWATNYQLVRFSDWPGRTRAGHPTADPRVAEALLRPVSHGSDQRISLYLVTGDEKAASAPALSGDQPNSKPTGGDSDDEGLFGGSDSENEGKPSTPAHKLDSERTQQSQEQLEDVAAAQLADRRLKGKVVTLGEIQGGQAPKSASTQFRFHRDYQAGENDGQPSANQYVIVLTKEGESPAASQAQSAWQAEQLAKKGHTPPDVGSGQKRPVAYYHPIAMQYTLRQKRVKRNDATRYPDMWAGVQVSDRAMSEWELRKAWRTRREVDHLDPMLEPDLSESEPEEDAVSVSSNGAPKDNATQVDAGIAEADVSVGDGSKNGERSPSRSRSSPDGFPSARSPSPKRAKSASASESGSDAETDADPEEMDDELAALQAEAEGQDDDVAEGRRRRRPAADADMASNRAADAADDDDDE